MEDKSLIKSLQRTLVANKWSGSWRNRLEAFTQRRWDLTIKVPIFRTMVTIGKNTIMLAAGRLFVTILSSQEKSGGVLVIDS